MRVTGTPAEDDAYTANPKHGKAVQATEHGGSPTANLARAGIAEMVGAFFLIYTGTATAVAATTGESIAGAAPDSLAVALAFGLVLAALVGALGQVSGAHLNPAVTLGLAVIGRFPWRYTPAYVLFQLAGRSSALPRRG